MEIINPEKLYSYKMMSILSHFSTHKHMQIHTDNVYTSPPLFTEDTFRTPSGYPKPRIVLTLYIPIFFLYIHTCDKAQFIH